MPHPRIPTRTVVATLVVSVLAALAGCDGGKRETEDDAASESPTATTAPRSPQPFLEIPPAEEIVQTLVELDTGTTYAEIEAEEVEIERSGSYRLSDAISRVETRYRQAPDIDLRITALSSDGMFFSQVDNGNDMRMDRCWLRNDTIDVDLAPEIAALAYLEDEGGLTTTDLYTVAGIVSPEFVESLGLTGEEDVRTPIDLQFAATGRVSGWSTTISRLAQSAKEAGLEPSSLLGFSDSDIDVTLTGLGEAVELDTPPLRRQVPVDPSAAPDPDIERVLRSCEAG